MKISNTKLVIHAERLSDDFFLHDNKSLQEFEAPNLEIVGDDFLHFNMSLKKLNAPNLETVRYNFLNYNKKIDKSKYR